MAEVTFRKEPSVEGKEVYSVFLDGKFFLHITETSNGKYWIGGFADDVPEEITRHMGSFRLKKDAKRKAEELAEKVRKCF